MKLRKIFAFALIGLIVFSSSAFALSLSDLISLPSSNQTQSEEPEIASGINPENALSSRPDSSVYFVVKLADTPRLFKWILSKENIDTLMPLILASQESNEIIGGLEIVSAIVENTPLKSAAFAVGMNKSDVKLGIPFFQMAFTVDKSASSIVKKISQGEASAVDVAKLILGVDSPFASFAETMIKVENVGENILKIDNEIFMKAQDGLVMLGTSLEELEASLNAFKDEKSRMFEKISRRFDKNDFAFIHMDTKTLSQIDEDEFKALKLEEYFDKPIEVEFAFERFKNKFSVLTGVNMQTALKKKYSAKITASKLKPVRGGNIDLDNAGSQQTPLLAAGGYFDFSSLKENDDLKSTVKTFIRQLKNRFGITEDETTNLLNGKFSLVVNGTVEIEGFKAPAVYLSQTGKKGAASKVYDRLVKSPHFQNVQDGILQVDSSLSPVSCLVKNREDTLDVAFAELSSLSEKPQLTPELDELIHKSAISAFWLNFAAVQSWLNDDENGVIAMAAPLAKIMGYGKYIDAAREVLSAELSVPSMSLWAENSEVFYTDFAIRDVKAENGLMSKLVKIYRDLSK